MSEAPPSPAEARQRLFSALQGIGVAFADALSLVDYDPAASTAYWKQDAGTGRDCICVGPTVVSLEADCLEVVLRHEILHRSLFHGFGERYTLRELSNLTLDVCINRLLFDAYPDAMRRASEALYSEESKVTPVALADCTAAPSRLDPRLADIWREIWTRKTATRTPVSPSSLYYRLLELGVAHLIPARYRRVDQGARAWPSRALHRAIDAVLAGLASALPRGSTMGHALSDFSVTPSSLGDDSVERFVRSLRIRRVVDDAAGALLEDLKHGVRIQPFPLLPSRIGLTYTAVGLTRTLGLHWNREARTEGGRFAMCVYVDVSGSMVPHFPLVLALVKALRGIPLRVRAFDTWLRDIEFTDLDGGTLQGGGGTDFNLPMEDLLVDKEVDAGLLLTDGCGDVSEHVARRVANGRKKLYVVYIRESSSRRDRGTDPLAQVADRVLVVPPLDSATPR